MGKNPKTSNQKTSAGMVLPQFDPATHPAAARTVSWGDVRVPALLDRDIPAGPLACLITSEQCPTGRHLFDAIEATGYETWDEEAETSTQAFRLVLTGVRCGLVEPLEGVQDTTRSRRTSVGPVPLRAGGLRAQQISHARRGRDTDSFLVHDTTDAVVGVINWARGKRGRAYYTGRLHTWPPGHYFEASTPIGCLCKLATAAMVQDGDPR